MSNNEQGNAGPGYFAGFERMGWAEGSTWAEDSAGAAAGLSAALRFGRDDKDLGAGRDAATGIKTLFALGATVGAGMFGAAAMAQQQVASAAVDPAPQSLPVQRFHVAEGTLDVALAEFGRQSGIRVKLEVAAGQLAGFHTAGVRGVLSNDAALRQLLNNTGLSFKLDGPDQVTVGLRHTDQVTVTATVPETIGLARFPEALLDTPQTVDVVPQFILQDQQNRTLTDAVRNVPGISIAAGESGAQGDSLTIRGFTARNDIFLDGIRDFGSYYRDSFNFEQVEVLEGPAGVQFGRGSTGGVINQESKVPTTDRFLRTGVQLGTDLTRRGTLDANLPLSDFAAGTVVRMNAMGGEGGVAGRPYAENRRWGVAPSITFGMNAATRATFSYEHFAENDTPDYGLPWLMNGLAPNVSRSAYFGLPANNYLNTQDDIATLRASHAFRGETELHTLARWANYPRQVDITEPQICGNATQSVPVGGLAAMPASALNSALPCPYTRATPASQIVVNRNQLAIHSVEGDLWDQTELTTRLKFFGIRNDFTGGVEGGREVSNPTKTSYSVSQTTNGVKGTVNTVTPTNLAAPNVNDAFGGTGYAASVTHVSSQSAGVYFVDTVKLGRYVELSGGVRWDLFDTVYNLYAPATAVQGAVLTAAIKPIEQKVTQPTYRAAFVYKPTSRGSVYFDYGTSFNPSAESLSLSVSSSILAPEENETFEVGAKYSFLNEKLRTEGAWFTTTKDNARETSPLNSNLIVLAGNQRVRGVQASAVGQLAGGTDLVLGYAYLSSAVTYSQFFPTSVGYQLANVPRQTFNAFLTRNLGLRFNGGFGGNYVAARTASSTVPFVPTSYGAPVSFATAAASPASCNATTCYPVLSTAMKQVPGYWVFNAMLRRPITEKIELQANVYNLLNRFYIDQPHPSHLIPAPGVSALVGVNYRF